jgi:hypothetical protein
VTTAVTAHVEKVTQRFEEQLSCHLQDEESRSCTLNSSREQQLLTLACARNKLTNQVP